MKTPKAEYKKYSLTSSRIYKVIEYNDGSFSCNCPSWIFKRGDVRNCKHIDEVKMEKPKEINANISGLNNNNQVVKVETTSRG